MSSLPASISYSLWDLLVHGLDVGQWARLDCPCCAAIELYDAALERNMLYQVTREGSWLRGTVRWIVSLEDTPRRD